MTDSSVRQAGEHASFLQRTIAAGHLRYWIIASWGLALATTTPWPPALAWFLVTLASGFARTVVETRVRLDDPRRYERLKLVVATLSCVAWSGAPLLSFFQGGEAGLALAIGLLIAGYMLVFTQMRAALNEALIVSSPYSVAGVVILTALWGHPGFLTVLALAPVLGLALLIKVVITQLKDAQLEAVNQKQSELIADLEQARDRADAASDAKSNFLGVISHELRTPMNGVLGAAQLLEATSLAERQQEYVSIIRRSGESLLVLLNDILDLTKIEAGKMELILGETRLDDLCERAIGPFRAQAEAKGLDFGLDLDADPATVVRCDPLRVAQVVQNLLSNAVKFTQAGRVSLRVSAARLGADGARLVFSVSDTGAGIAADSLQQLFQPFTQVDASSTRRFGGTGLGLSICRRLAGLMGGDITVESRLGQGSTFELAFDCEVVAWRSVEVQHAELVETEAPGQALSVLVVEDHPVNRMVLQAWLASLGHACTLAEHGGVALELAAASAFDLVIMDVNMPVMDGLAATAEIRRLDGANRDTPIAVLSASARAEDHAQGFAAGADAYVDKPVDFATLAQVLAAAPAGRHAVRALRGLEAAA